MKNSKGKSEFEEFKQSQSEIPPSHLSAQLFQSVEPDIKATPYWVFSKLSLIHLFSGLMTLSVCPQFGVRVWGEGLGLMKTFMGLGSYGCVLACGFFFMGSSLLLAALVLKPYEILAIRRHRFVEIGAIVLLSMGFFLMIDVKEVLTGLTLAWIVGAVLGGVTLLELGWLFRKPMMANEARP